VITDEVGKGSSFAEISAQRSRNRRDNKIKSALNLMSPLQCLSSYPSDETGLVVKTLDIFYAHPFLSPSETAWEEGNCQEI
jgi:hypothetical protein